MKHGRSPIVMMPVIFIAPKDGVHQKVVTTSRSEGARRTA